MNDYTILHTQIVTKKQLAHYTQPPRC